MRFDNLLIAFFGGKLRYVSESGVSDLSSQLGAAGVTFRQGGAAASGAAGERFRRLSWSEMP